MPPTKIQPTGKAGRQRDMRRRVETTNRTRLSELIALCENPALWGALTPPQRQEVQREINLMTLQAVALLVERQGEL